MEPSAHAARLAISRVVSAESPLSRRSASAASRSCVRMFIGPPKWPSTIRDANRARPIYSYPSGSCAPLERDAFEPPHASLREVVLRTTIEAQRRLISRSASSEGRLRRRRNQARSAAQAELRFAPRSGLVGLTLAARAFSAKNVNRARPGGDLHRLTRILRDHELLAGRQGDALAVHDDDRAPFGHEHVLVERMRVLR